MTMRHLLFILALVYSLHGLAQPTFEKYYLTSGGAGLFLREQESGNIITGIGGFTLMDAEGNLLNSRGYDTNPMTNKLGVEKRADNEFYFAAGLIDDSCAIEATLEINPVIGTMDSMGILTSMHHYQLNALSCWNTAGAVLPTSDGGCVALGTTESFFILRVDAMGDVLWSRQFLNSGRFLFARELGNGDMLVGMYIDTAGAVLARMTGEGEFIWCRSYFRPNGFLTDCIVEADGSFTVLGATDHMVEEGAVFPLAYQPQVFIMRLDSDGVVQWCKGYHSATRWFFAGSRKVHQLANGQYVVLGTLSNGSTNVAQRPCLIKVDVNGDTLWTRSAGVGGYQHSARDLMICSDGGILFSNSVSGAFGLSSSAICLFKADSTGHLPCSEVAPPLITVSDLFPTDSSFALTWIEGAERFTGSVETYISANEEVLNGCTITAIGAPTQNRRSTNVHPNPNAGQFTVSFQDPLRAGSYYSVYDTLGKLLFQRPLSTGTSAETVDLSRFGRGTYVLKFTKADEVCYERVVVE